VKLILKEEVDNLGLPGDVVDVAAGYGRNYLVPRGLAIRATRGALKEAQTLTRARKAREARTFGDAEEFKRILESRTLRVEARVDEKGTLYGSVGAGDVQRVLKERGHEIEQRRVDLQRPIKAIGAYTVEVHVHPQVSAEVPIEVVDVEGEVTVEGLAAALRTEAEERAALEEAALEAAEELEAEEREAEEAEAAEAEVEEADDAGDRPARAPAAADDESDAAAAEPDEGALAAHASAPSDIAAPRTPEEILAEREGSDDDEDTEERTE
jgi:large subunit ribosomal protein L9